MRAVGVRAETPADAGPGSGTLAALPGDISVAAEECVEPDQLLQEQ